jgi:hypothetical protein
MAFLYQVEIVSLEQKLNWLSNIGIAVRKWNAEILQGLLVR